MGRGLDQEGRDIIRDMVRHKATGEDVRAKVDKLVKSDGWDAEKNKALVEELKERGYPKTAEHLEEKNKRG